MLKGEKILLRAVEPEDAEILYKWENDFEMWKVSNTLKPFSLNVIKKYIETEHLDIFEAKQLRLMIQKIDSEIIVGMIDLFDFDPYHRRAGVGIMINKMYRQNGFADEALKIIIKYSFSFLNLHQLYCNIAENNENSLKLFKNNGFEIIGLKKDWNFNGKEFENVFLLQQINPHKKISKTL